MSTQEIEKKAANIELSDEWKALQEHVSVIDKTYVVHEVRVYSA